MSASSAAEKAFCVRPLALPAAWSNLPGAGAALLCEGDPLDTDFERARMPSAGPQAGPKRRREFLAGRLAAAQALKALAWADAAAPAAGPDRLPQWPAGVLGSISHSGDAALAWVVQADAVAGVGIDVEALMAAPRCERLWRRIAPELVPGQGAAAGWSDECLLTLAFSAKESLFKALYPSVRRYFGFEAAHVAGWAPDGNSLRLRLQADWSAEWRAGRELTAHCSVDVESARVMTLLQAPSVK